MFWGVLWRPLPQAQNAPGFGEKNLIVDRMVFWVVRPGQEKNADIDETGIWDYIYSDGITVIEWAERLGEIQDDFIRVKFAIIDKEARDITIEGMDEKDWNRI